MSDRLLITCEHGGHRVPRRHAALFAGAEAVLASHRGWDAGSLDLAKRLADTCAAPLLAVTVTRLLVEPNRSPGHPRLFSEFTRPLPPVERQALLDEYYHPHRRAVEEWIARETGHGNRVWHLSVHTFTPILDGEERRADVGLLYDPRRTGERQLCRQWQAALRTRRPELRVRMNYPYLGRSDGLTTHLRRRFSDANYAGIEIEVNQRWPQQRPRKWRPLQTDIITALCAVLPDWSI